MEYRLSIGEVCEILKEKFEAESCEDYSYDGYFKLQVKTKCVPSKNEPK